MKFRQMILIGVLSVLAPIAAAADKKLASSHPSEAATETPVEQSIVIKYAGARPANVLGKQVLMIGGTNMGTGRIVSVVVPNTDPNSRKMEPDPTIKDFLDEHAKGDFIEVTVDVTKGKMTAKEVKEYQAKAGEEEPNIYVYDSATDVPTHVKDKTAPAIKVTRFKAEKTFLIPQVRDTAGSGMMNKPEIAKVTDALQNGELVEIQFMGGGATPTIRSIVVYEAPKTGIYVRLTKDTVDDKPVQAVEIEEADGGTKTTLPIAKASLNTIIGKLRGIRPNSDVLYKTVTDDKNYTWLIDIKPAPKESTAKPHGKTIPKEKSLLPK